MNHHLIEQDIEFIKKEIRLGINFLKDFFHGQAKGTQKGHVVRIIKYGPFNMIKLLGAIIITLYFLLTFHLYRSETTWWVTLLIFLAVYDLIFERTWVVPVAQAVWEIIHGIFKEIFGLFSFGGSAPAAPADKKDAPKK